MLRKTMLLATLGLIGIALTAVFYGQFRWKSGTKELRARLESARLPMKPKFYDQAELAGLPAPVERYFRAIMKVKQPIVAAAELEHTGTFNMGETTDAWKPFKSTQRVIALRPGFVWDGRIAIMPGLSVHVHDAYVSGEGILHAAVLGLVSVVHLRGTGELAKGELMRFYAEAAWYPTALLPSQGIHWEPVDDHSARGTLKEGDFTVTLLFHFNREGLIDSVRADGRARTVGDRFVPTPWQGRFWNYAIQDGMLVPMEGEVAWLSTEGQKPYWKGRISKIKYEFAP